MNISGDLGYETTSRDITINPSLVANFSGAPINGTTDTVFVFNDSSTGIPTAWNWSFGDGSVNVITQNATHSFNSIGDYNISLMITNGTRSDTETKIDYIHVGDVPISDFESNETYGTVDSTFLFTNLSSETPISWYWTFGDGDNSIEENPTHSYTVIGNYNVSLVATNIYGTGNNETKIDYIHIGSQPVAAFSANNTTPIINRNVLFTDSSTNSPTAWNWSFGDGTYSEVQNPVHAFSTVDTFNISLNASNVYGYTIETKVDYITSGEIPVAAFSANNTTPIIDRNVLFTDLSTGAPTAWNWSFGDGTYSEVQNPVHAFSTVDTFTVILNSSNLWGYDLETKVGYITSGEIPVAAFSANDTTPNTGDIVLFTDESTNSPTAWNWSFGDSTYSELQNPTHAYSSEGNFTVSLNASNVHGYTIETKTDYIYYGEIPVASFTVSNTTARVSGSITFTDTSGHEPTAWYWTFGDGNTSSLQNPTNIYSAIGDYTIVLNASNVHGYNVLTETDYIGVYDVITAAFSATNLTGHAPLFSHFTDSSTGNPTSWYWTFGDSTTSAEQNPIAIYSTVPGLYDVVLVATNPYYTDTETKLNYINIDVDIVIRFENYYYYPTDIDSDGKYMDCNGNGYLDSQDVDIHYGAMQWIIANQPVQPFDYNSNGYVDYADSILLHDSI